MKRKIPKMYIIISKGYGTKATRKKKTGVLTGRKRVKNGDKTYNIRLKKSVDLNKNGRIDNNERGGIILGRTKKVKSSKRAKGYQRRIR